MIIRKLRLQRGWTQEQLAEMSGLSVRSVQRIERGQSASLESLKSLAAVFEVELSVLQPGASDMNDNNYTRVTPDEELAMNYAKGLKEFWSHLLVFVVFGAVFLFTDRFEDTMMGWMLLGWSVGILLHGLVAYEVINIFGPGWEKKTIEKRLGRKL